MLTLLIDGVQVASTNKAGGSYGGVAMDVTNIIKSYNGNYNEIQLYCESSGYTVYVIANELTVFQENYGGSYCGRYIDVTKWFQLLGI